MINGVDAMVVFGGEDAQKKALNDTWVLYIHYDKVKNKQISMDRKK